jgi:hypothetical protein
MGSLAPFMGGQICTVPCEGSLAQEGDHMTLESAHLPEKCHVRRVVLDQIDGDSYRVCCHDAALLFFCRDPEQDLKSPLECQDLLHFGVATGESNHQQKYL